MSWIALVPTYNEAANISWLLPRLLSAGPDHHILFIDDNSPDGTAAEVERLAGRNPRVHLLSRPRKDGLGPAYIAGINWAMEHDYERMVQMDGDLSHAPEDAIRLAQTLDECDMVIGSRYVPGGEIVGWPVTRLIISRGGSLFARSCLGVPYRDMTGGFNAWRREALEKINYRNIQTKGYAFQVELKYRAHLATLRVRELPIRFEDRVRGESKMSEAIVREAARRVVEMRWRPWKPSEATTPRNG